MAKKIDPLPEPTRTHLGWLLDKVRKDPAYPEARVLWEEWCTWIDKTKEPLRGWSPRRKLGGVKERRQR